MRRSRYFFFAAFFLAAGFLAAFFFAAMMVYLLNSISGPMKVLVLAGPRCISRKGCHSSGGRLCDGDHEQHRFQTVVILELGHFCQWGSHDGVSETTNDVASVTLTVKRHAYAWLDSETEVGDVQGRGLEPHCL